MSVSVVTYADRHYEGVKALWLECFPDDRPWNAAEFSIPAKLKCQPELFLVALDAGQVVGSVMAGYTGHRGWIDRIAVRESHQRKHVGAALISEAEARLLAMGCVKVNLQVLTANAPAASFYTRVGYSIEDRISMSKLIGSRYAASEDQSKLE
jgi:ribosomal protein S18 acetylase RimI-like enzyme